MMRVSSINASNAIISIAVGSVRVRGRRYLSPSPLSLAFVILAVTLQAENSAWHVGGTTLCYGFVSLFPNNSTSETISGNGRLQSDVTGPLCGLSSALQFFIAT